MEEQDEESQGRAPELLRHQETLAMSCRLAGRGGVLA